MPRRILLIEDNPANLELMSYILTMYGYTLSTAMDGEEGIKAALAGQPKLIVCDVHLPKKDGYEVARFLKADPSLRDIPLIAVTALAMVGDRDKVLNAGFDGYIAKPIDPAEFVEKIEGYLPRGTVNTNSDVQLVENSASITPPHRYTILVVDNMPVHLELARSILAPHGYRVLTANGLSEGLATANQNACDLILSDVCMANGDGYDFLQAVKADPKLKDIPFLFLTSTMRNESGRAKGLGLGATRYLWRPIEPEELLAEIESCLLRK